MNFKHIWCTFWCTVSLASVDRTIDFEVVPVGIFQRTLLWRTFYSLHGLFNNILLNNSGIELYMLILPAFIHARYYIRNSISAEPCQTIVSAFFFFFWSLQLSTIWLYLHVRETWRNHWPGFGLMVVKWPSKTTKLTLREKKILKHMLLFCSDLRAVGVEQKRTLAATEELGDGTRTFNYGPHLQTGPSASVRIISGGAPWPPPLSPSMNQTFHYMLTLLSCAECMYAMGKWRGIGNLKGDG